MGFLCTFDDFRVFFPPGRGAAPLVAIMVRVGLRAVQMFFVGHRVVGSVVGEGPGAIGFISAYIRPVRGDGVDQLSRALAQAGHLHLCVGMDANGHSPLWGPETVALDSVGEMVEGVLGESGLLVVNERGSPATFRGDRGFSTWIDVTAVSPALAPRVSQWRVCDHLELASDHHLVETFISGCPRRGTVRTVRSWDAVDWPVFGTRLRAALGPPDRKSVV